jgi:hypothetical protein
MTKERKYKLIPNTLIRKDLHGYLVYVPGAPLLFLNKTANDIFHLIKKNKNKQEIVNFISKKYKKNKTIVEKDVTNFLKKLKNKGFLLTKD